MVWHPGTGGAAAEQCQGHVLVAADESLLRELALRAPSAGLWLEPCDSAVDVLAQLASSPVDAVICQADIHGSSGLGLCYAVQATHPTVPVILITPHAEWTHAASEAAPFDVVAVSAGFEACVAAIIRAVRYRRARSNGAGGRATEDFVYAITHALRNRLRHISSWVDATTSATSLVDAHIAAHQIDMAVGRIDTQVTQLMLLARTDRDVPCEALDMAPLVAAACRRLEAPLDLTLPEDWPAAIGYGPWVEEIWFNLLNNAARHGGGRPRAVIGAEVHGDHVSFSVADNGPGIPASHRLRIFEPFARLTARVPGSGLGLTLAARIVRRLGGELVLDDAPGEGATFRFSLPLVAEAEDADDFERSAEARVRPEQGAAFHRGESRASPGASLSGASSAFGASVWGRKS